MAANAPEYDNAFNVPQYREIMLHLRRVYSSLCRYDTKQGYS